MAERETCEFLRLISCITTKSFSSSDMIRGLHARGTFSFGII